MVRLVQTGLVQLHQSEQPKAETAGKKAACVRKHRSGDQRASAARAEKTSASRSGWQGIPSHRSRTQKEPSRFNHTCLPGTNGTSHQSKSTSEELPREAKQIDTNQLLMDGHDNNFYGTVQPFVAYCSSEIVHHSDTSQRGCPKGFF